MENEKNLNKYGQSFQLTALSLFFKDKAFCSKIKGILLPDYFDNKYTQAICQMGVEYLEKYFKFPEEDKIFEIIKSTIERTKSATSKIYLGYLDNIKNADLSSSVYVKEEIEKFCFTKFALQKLEEQKNNIELGQFEEAKNIAMTTYVPVNSNYTELKLTEAAQVIAEQATIHRPVPSIFPTFNFKSKGGPGAGDLAVVVAQSSFGKTAYLTALARYLATIGKKVLYFSLETDRYQLISRCTAGLVNIEQENLSQHPKLVKTKIKEITDKNGEVLFVELKAISARIGSLKLILEEKKAQGFFPDVIIVDGLNQLKLPKGIRNNDNNDKFEYLAEELRDWGKEEQFPIWCSFQTNRCLSLDTLVDLKDKGKVRIANLKEGEEILTHQGYKKITKIFPIETQPVYKIKLKSGKEIICSGEHEFPLKNGNLLNINNGLREGFKLLVKKD